MFYALMAKSNAKKPFITKTPEGVRFGIRVLPNTSRCEIVGVIDDELKSRLDVPPIEGKANEI